MLWLTNYPAILIVGGFPIPSFRLGYAKKFLNLRLREHVRIELGHSQRLVALCLVVASITAIAHFAVPSVFSQGYATVTSNLTYTSVGFTTSTSFLTAVTVEFSNTYSYLTYVSIAWVTSTSYLTYVESATSTTTRAAPWFHLPSSTSLLSMNYLSGILYAFLAIWVGIRLQAFYTVTVHLFRRILPT
jgi:predicted neutral ceramidase superfamily lipid hydrolase